MWEYKDGKKLLRLKKIKGYSDGGKNAHRVINANEEKKGVMI